MALLFIDGFDHWNNMNQLKWGASSFSVSSGAARTGTQGLSGGSGTPVITSKFFMTNGSIVLGFAIRTSMSGYGTFLEIRENYTIHVYLSWVAPGVIQVNLGTNAVLATGTIPLVPNNWHYVEFKATIGNTGSFEVRIDGSSDAALTVPVADTQNGLSGIWDNLRFINPTNSIHIDDLYLCDTSGPAPHNDFLGVLRVETLYPQVGNGTSVGLTPSTGTDHGALVDEAAPNTTDYNSSLTVGAKDTYNYPPTTLTGTILGVQTNMYVAKSDSSGRQVTPVLQVGGTDYDGAPSSLASTYGYLSNAFGEKPAGGTWTAADIASLQAGMKVVG